MTSYVGGFEWLIILGMGSVFFLLPIALLVFLFIKLSPKGRWILGSVLMVPVLLAALLLAFKFGVHSYVSPVGVDTYPAPDARPQVSISQTWSGENEQMTSQSIQYHSAGEVGVAQIAGRARWAGVSFLAMLVVLLLFGPLAVLLVVLFIKSGRKGRIIIGSLAGVTLPLLAFAAVAYFVSERSRVPLVFPNQQPNTLDTPDQQHQAAESQAKYLKHVEETFRSYSQAEVPEPTSQPIGGSGVERRDLAAAGFEPDIHASKESAVRAVARLAAQQYKALVTSPDQMPKSMQIAYSQGLVNGESINAGGAFGDVALREMKEVFGRPVAAFIEGPVKPPVPERATYNDALLYLSLDREPQTTRETEEAGRVEATMSGPFGRTVQYAEYLSKPWQEDFHRWRKRASDSASWVLGESPDFCVSRQESIDRAIQAAVPGVHLPISKAIGDMPQLAAGWRNNQADLYRWVDSEVSRRLKAGDLQTDVFTQEFKRPYGSVWRSAVLVHVPRDTAREILNTYRVQTDARQTTWLHTLLSGAGLLALIVAVYLFLNMATRGYYVWSVRLATVVLAGVGAWCIVMFVR